MASPVSGYGGTRLPVGFTDASINACVSMIPVDGE